MKTCTLANKKVQMRVEQGSKDLYGNSCCTYINEILLKKTFVIFWHRKHRTKTNTRDLNRIASLWYFLLLLLLFIRGKKRCNVAILFCITFVKIKLETCTILLERIRAGIFKSVYRIDAFIVSSRPRVHMNNKKYGKIYGFVREFYLTATAFFR